MAKPVFAPPRQAMGLPAAKWREVSAFLLLFLALLLFLSQASASLERHWIGFVGDALSRLAGFLFGMYIAFVVPVLFFLAAVHAFRGQVPFHPVRKGLAGFLILLSLCAWLSLPAALDAVNNDPTATFAQGGALGDFITRSDGLGLAEKYGPAGAHLVCFAALALGIMLSTDFLFIPLLHALYGRIALLLAALRRRKPVAVLQFGSPAAGSGAFPTIGGGKGDPAGPRRELQMDAETAALLAEADEAIRLKTQPPDLFEAFLPEAEAAVKDAAPPKPARAEKPERGEKAERAERLEMVQTELNFQFDSPDYHQPPLSLFSPPPAGTQTMDKNEVAQISGELEKALSDFGISARVVAVTQGPVVTQYELQPAPGVKVSRILSLESDMALILCAKSVRIQAPIPGKAAIGVEVPNRKVTPVYFRELIESPEFLKHPSPLAFVLGKNIAGDPVVCDLATMPHLLIAGTTGSGKSVCVNMIISSILFRMSPAQVKFIMIDPKRVELNVYSDIPHLLAPVVNEPRQAAAALQWAVQQMEERLRIFSSMRVRNIDGYNAVVQGKRSASRGVRIEDHAYLPHIVIIIDELADLMLIAKNEVEDFIVRLAQMSRAAGIHMIIATQRPSVNVLTGLIKANFPSRIAFRVSAKVDSRTILDMNGAETLLGKGDMLFSPGGTKPLRIQGAFLSDPDVEKMTDFLRAQSPAAYQQEGFAADFSGSSESQDAELESGLLAPAGNGGRGGSIDSEDAALEPDTGPDPGRTSPPRPSSFPQFDLNAPVEFPPLQLQGEMDEDEELYDKALRMVLESGKPSVSMIQRRLKIGFARAGRLMDLMEERGIVGPYLGSKPRDLIIDDPEGLLRRLNEIDRDRQ